MNTSLNAKPNLNEVIRELQNKAMNSTDPSVETAINIPELEHGNLKVKDGYIVSFYYSKGGYNHPRGYYVSVSPGYVENKPDLGQIVSTDLFNTVNLLLNNSEVKRKSKHSRNEALGNLNKQTLTKLIEKCHQNIKNRHNKNN